MQFLKNRWQIVTLIYIFISYPLLITLMNLPFSAYLIGLAAFTLLLILVFLGTFIGILGVLSQLIIKKYAFTKKLYQLAYSLKTENPSILASYGLILLRDHAYAEAFTCFQRALSHTSYFLTTKTLKGNQAICYWKQNQIEKAIATYEDIIKVYGITDQPFLTEPNYSKDAIASFIQDNPYLYPQDCVTLGYLYLSIDAYEKALFFTYVALSLSPDYASAYDNLGQIAFRQKDFILGESYFKKALDLQPNLPDSLYYMGLSLLERDATTEAHDYLTKANACHLDGLNTITYSMINDALAHS